MPTPAPSIGAAEPHVRLRAGDDPADQLDVVARDLHRYYTLLIDELARVSLTPDELVVVLDACRGQCLETWAYRRLWALVQTHLLEPQHLAAPRLLPVAGMALVNTLRHLSGGEQLALCDAVERFWRGPWEAEPASAAAVDPGQLRERLRVVGLLR